MHTRKTRALNGNHIIPAAWAWQGRLYHLQIYAAVPPKACKVVQQKDTGPALPSRQIRLNTSASA